MPTLQITNQVIWITGASSGIGEALAHQLAMQPEVRLILSARREDELQRVKHALNIDLLRVLVLPFDVADLERHSSVVDQAVNAFGRVDIMIHNAGVSQRSMILDTQMSTYHRLMAVDYFGPVSITKHLLPHMIAAGGGHFVVISSVAGKIGTIMRSGYCGAKFAIIGFFDALRAEHHDDQIRVTTICPGFINTNVTKNALSGDGSAYNRVENDASHGLSAQTCAQKIIESIQKGKQEVVIGGTKETIAAYLRRFAPNLLFKIIRNNPPK